MFNKRKKSCNRKTDADMILHAENAKHATKEPVETNEHSKVASWKINTQKSVAFLDTSNEQMRIKRKYENNPIHNCFRKNQTPGITCLTQWEEFLHGGGGVTQ